MSDGGERSARMLALIDRVAEICARLPEVEQGVDGFGHATFKVGKRSLVLIGGGRDGGGSLNIKADHAAQDFLVRCGPYERTPYIGQHGWVTLWGEAEIDWDEVAGLVRDAYRMVAPKRLLRELEQAGG